MKTPRPTSAKLLEKTLARERGELTVADAATRSGLPLREAEEGLRYLAAEYGGHLAATEKGEILYSFPRGLEKPPETRLGRRFLRAIGRGVMGVGRFIVRAWVSIVLVGYALAFLALLIALALRSDRDEGPGDAILVVLRVVAEALYWTFHPFSPVYISQEPGWMHRRGKRGDKVPFYEKVNRFVFGPRPPEVDPRLQERNVLAEIRRLKGRLATSDVMRVTGLDREAAEGLLLRLMVDYSGDLEVADNAAIVYRFPDLRTTAGDEIEGRAPPPFWSGRTVLPELTGNTGGTNAIFVLINGFNLAASSYALATGLTLDRIGEMLARVGERFPEPLPPADGLPIVFGAIPFAFSAALFALPLARALRRKNEVKRVGRENGWRGVLRQVLAGRRGSVIQTPAELAAAWVATGGHPPSEQELTDAVRAAGGEVDLGEDGQIIYKFHAVEGELQASATERAAASAEEARPGQVVFSSADEGAGIRNQAAPGARPSAAASPPPPRALPERGTTLPDLAHPPDSTKETAEELLARIGVDTRRRGR